MNHVLNVWNPGTKKRPQKEGAHNVAHRQNTWITKYTSFPPNDSTLPLGADHKLETSHFPWSLEVPEAGGQAVAGDKLLEGHWISWHEGCTFKGKKCLNRKLASLDSQVKSVIFPLKWISFPYLPGEGLQILTKMQFLPSFLSFIPSLPASCSILLLALSSFSASLSFPVSTNGPGCHSNSQFKCSTFGLRWISLMRIAHLPLTTASTALRWAGCLLKIGSL